MLDRVCGGARGGASPAGPGSAAGPKGVEPEALEALGRLLKGAGRQTELAPDGRELLLRAPVEAVADQWLPTLARDLEKYHRQAGAVRAEIVETCWQAVGGTEPAGRLSGRFRVVSGQAPSRPDEIWLAPAPGVFGSGLHPSTRLAVRALEELAGQEGLPARVLDVGTGSGILAILSGRLGAREVLGLDISAEAVAAARRNVAANGLADRVEIADSPLNAVPGRFELVLANITPAVQLRLRSGILARLAPGGRLIVAGFQAGRFAGEAGPLQEAGLNLEKRYEEEGWGAGRFRRPLPR